MTTDEIQAVLVDLAALSRLLGRVTRQVEEIEGRVARAVPDDLRTWAESETVEVVPLAVGREAPA